jgi:hypothetical protein
VIDQVNSIRNGTSKRIQFEIMIVDTLGLQTPALTVVLEIANQFLLFDINADDWPAFAQKVLFLRLNVLKLRVSVWMLLPGLTFDIGFERIIHLFQQSPNRIWTGYIALGFQAVAQMSQTTPQPFLGIHRIACCLWLDQGLQSSLYRRVFFSTG